MLSLVLCFSCSKDNTNKNNSISRTPPTSTSSHSGLPRRVISVPDGTPFVLANYSSPANIETARQAIEDLAEDIKDTLFQYDFPQRVDVLSKMRLKIAALADNLDYPNIHILENDLRHPGLAPIGHVAYITNGVHDAANDFVATLVMHNLLDPNPGDADSSRAAAEYVRTIRSGSNLAGNLVLLSELVAVINPIYNFSDVINNRILGQHCDFAVLNVRLTEVSSYVAESNKVSTVYNNLYKMHCSCEFLAELSAALDRRDLNTIMAAISMLDNARTNDLDSLESRYGRVAPLATALRNMVA
jgi:hypothetical protein